jgi:hypothetical protein
MLRSCLVTVLGLVIPVSEASAIIVAYLDEFDDPETINAVADVEQIKRCRAETQKLASQLQKLEPATLEALLGKPGKKQRKTYAMPLGETRSIALSGLREVNDKRPDEDFVSFHPVGDFAAVEFYYSRQRKPNDAPLAARIYLKVDDTFPKLTKDNLDQRLAWERTQLEKLVKHISNKAGALPSGASGEELKNLVETFGKSDKAD